MNVQWYPGHMTKAVRMMKEDIKLIDLVIELLDARVPISSRNPEIDKLCENKSRLILLNKSDLADEVQTDKWVSFFEDKGICVLKVNSLNAASLKKIDPLVKEACKEKIERDRKRGIINRPVRAMVVGIPNVGKSTFINSFSKKAVAQTGNKPGVTKGKQWIKLSKTLELLDTPGILWPKFEDEKIGIRLALIGSINDTILQKQELCLHLLDFLKENVKGALNKRYEVDESHSNMELFDEMCEKRACFKKGGEYDYEKMSSFLLDDFRSGRLGKITLDLYEENR